MLDRLRAGLSAPGANLDANPGTDLGAAWRGDDGVSLARRDGIPAAVLIPVVMRDDPQILLTIRSAAMKKHAGEISFPGGRIDPLDDGPEAAALRETEEEIAVPRHSIEIVGRLSPYQTGTGFDIIPIVGLLPPFIEPVGNPQEVEEIFEVPLAYLLDKSHYRRETAVWKGQVRHFFVIPYQGYAIWGATAGILADLAQVMERLVPGQGVPTR